MSVAICQSCGKPHDDLAFAIPVRLPTVVTPISEAERESRVWSNGELCVLDDLSFFLYGSIEIPIHGHEGHFIWGAWVQLSEEHFFWYQQLLDDEGREANEPFNALLATDIPFYPPTRDLPTLVTLQPKGYRPLFQLTSTEHQLGQDQAHGVEPERIEAIKRWFASLPGRGGA